MDRAVELLSAIAIKKIIAKQRSIRASIKRFCNSRGRESRLATFFQVARESLFNRHVDKETCLRSSLGPVDRDRPKSSWLATMALEHELRVQLFWHSSVSELAVRVLRVGLSSSSSSFSSSSPRPPNSMPSYIRISMDSSGPLFA